MGNTLRGSVQAEFRGVPNRDATPSRTKKLEEERTAAALELVDTERTYVTSLHVLLSKFVQPMGKKKVLPVETLFKIFGNIKQIYDFHHSLLSAMEEKRRKWNVSKSKIGDLFLDRKQANKWLVYAPYLDKYEEALTTLESARKSSSKARKWIDAREVETGHTLEALLILPVQRLPRYILLLQRLLDCTWSGHPDEETLLLAAAKVKGFMEQINAKKRRAHEIARVRFYATAFKGHVEGLDDPLRRFVREGQVRDLSKETKIKHRFLVLFNDSLLVAKVLNWTRDLPADQLKLKFIRFHNIKNVLVGPGPTFPEPEVMKKDQWMLLRTPTHNYVLDFEGPGLLEDWRSALETTRERYMRDWLKKRKLKKDRQAGDACVVM